MTDSGPAGGNGGIAFDDMPPNHMEIGGLRIRSGLYIDQIQVVYRNPANGQVAPGPAHGGQGGEPTEITLRADEFITEINGRTGKFVDSLTLKTNQGRIFSNLGGDGGQNSFRFHLDTTAGEEVFGFFGRAGLFLDAIGVHTRQRP